MQGIPYHVYRAIAKNYNYFKSFQGVREMNDNEHLCMDDVLTAEEMQNRYTLRELLAFVREGQLQSWLSENIGGYSAESWDLDEIAEVSDEELLLRLCELLKYDINAIGENEAAAVSRALCRRRQREIYVDKKISDGAGAFVQNQREMLKAERLGYNVIYLIGGEYQIPSPNAIPRLKAPITYIGRENAVIEVSDEKDINFDELQITFVDVQLFLRHRINITAENSTGLKLLYGDKISADESMRREEVARLMYGREAFETYEMFKTRAEKAEGIVVGDVLIEPHRYDIKSGQLLLRPVWKLNFFEAVRSFAYGKSFIVRIEPEQGAQICRCERKQLIYANFTVNGDTAAISKIYMLSETTGRIDILALNELAGQTGGSQSGCRGYGLNLIDGADEITLSQLSGEVLNRL